MNWLVLVLVLAGCAAEPQPIMAPPDVLARQGTGADTSHDPTLWESSTGGCDGPSGDSMFGGCGGGSGGEYRHGCGSPHGGGRGGGGRRGGGFTVLGAIALVLRRRRA